MSQAVSSFMQRALELAARGRGSVEPNPLVGCVIERGGRIIGEGFHERFGGPHAEINALAACSESPAGATVHVTLEPCCHSNKKTPPCVPKLIEAKVAWVLIGCLDPDPAVSGQGAAQLRAASMDVHVGVLEAECRQINAAYMARVIHNRPYVTLKWAVSADGMIAGREGRRVQIAGEAATAAVHALRGRCDAIAVGTNTLLNDDPLLTVRTPNPPRLPLRVVLSNRLLLPKDRRLFQTALADHPVLVYTSEPRADSPDASAIRSCGAEVVGLPAKDNWRGDVRFSMNDVYADLARRRVTHLLVEPGAQLARELIDRSQADRAWVIRGQMTIAQSGITAPLCPWPIAGSRQLEGDRLREHLNTDSKVFFAMEESADLALTHR